ncbi:MAG: helix-turn-helix transcriptional regulator [Acutalibacteraceae bacterium]|nr:helix-turn-helix transcriptional regulator [Acutalibacteraceae bacterium]
MKYSLKAIRINKGDTQEQASKGIGISVETLANYEKGITYPDIPILKKIEKYYNVNYNDIDFFCNEITVKQ